MPGVPSETSRAPRPCLSGFESIRRSFMPGLDRIVARILPGEYYVTREDEGILTVLGSCVSACVFDPEAGIGGLNHFMLPTSRRSPKSGSDPESARFGAYAMELLINALLRNGAARERLRFKLFGAGRIIGNMSDIGNQNACFVAQYLETEGFRVDSQDMGGRWARKIVFFPRTGKVRCKRMVPQSTEKLVERDTNLRREITNKPNTGGIELFDTPSPGRE